MDNQPPKTVMESPKHLCQSCNCLVEEDAAFCSICGQKKIYKTASVRELLGDVVSNLFSLDSKFIRTFTALLFIPGKLTKAYFAGQRQLYYTPIRLFLVSMTASFILFAFANSNEIEQSFSNDAKVVALKSYQDSIRPKLYQLFPDSVSKHKIDQLISRPKKESSSKVSKLPFNHDDPSFLDAFNNVLSGDDLYLLAPDEIIEKYHIKGFWKQLLIRQLIKIRVLDTFDSYVTSHLSWLILISIPFLALFMKLLYVRKKYLYAEHLVHLLHIHTLISVVFSCWVIWRWLQDENYNSSMSIFLAVIGSILYFLISMKRVYGQSKRKTFFKILIFTMGYIIILAFSSILFLMLVFFLF